MTDNKQVNGSESLWFQDRCLWCQGEVKGAEAIREGEKAWCCAYCKRMDLANPEGAEA